MFRSRMGQVESVATHWAIFMPQPQVHGALLARRSAVRLAPGDSDEKSTTRMSYSSHGPPEYCEMPYTTSVATAMPIVHLRALARGVGRRRRRSASRARFFIRPGARLSHEVANKPCNGTATALPCNGRVTR